MGYIEGSDRHQQINEAYQRMLRGDVRYRFVIDMASLKNRTASAC